MDRDVVELVRELALVQPDSYIASTLNRLGYQSGTGKTWNETRVKNLRNYNQIPVFVGGTERSWLTLEEAAATLKTGVTVIRTMIRKGLLPARQVAKHAPWTIKREDLERPEIPQLRAGDAPWKIFSIHKRPANELTQFMNEAETGGSVLRASSGLKRDVLAGQCSVASKVV